VAGWPDFIGVVDASSHGVGGVIIGELSECLPTVFRLQWPPDITANVKSEANPKGTITNSDLELDDGARMWNPH
jgi:hypothetical protein